MLQIVHKNSEAHGTKNTNCDTYTALSLVDRDRVILLLFFDIGGNWFSCVGVCFRDLACVSWVYGDLLCGDGFKRG